MAYSHRITPEMGNFSRLAMCIIGPGTQMMRDILSVKVQPSSLRNLVSYSNLKLNHEQKLQLSSGADPDYANFDISFIYKLLRTPGICRPPLPAPTNGWSFPPSSKYQVTLGDDIERLRILKNQICSHIKKPELSKNEFDDKIAEMKKLAMRIDTFLAPSTDYVKEICEIESENLENEVYDYFIEQIKELKKREQDFDEKIRNVEDQMNQKIEVISHDVEMEKEKTDRINTKLKEAVETIETFSQEAEAQKEQEDAFLKQIQTDDYIFIESNVSKSTLTLLEKTKVIIIIGITGQGKTVLSRHVAIHLLNNGYKIFNIRSAEEFKRKCNPKTRAVYLIDDIFGKHYKKQYEVDSWLQNVDDVSQWSQNYDMYLICTSQKIVWHDCQPYIRTFALFQTENIVDLTLDKMKLSYHEKDEMLKKHLIARNRNISERMLHEIIKIESPIGFPYCCSSFSSNDELYALGPEYFRNTKISLRKEFERLSEIDNEKFCVLLSVMVLGNSFPFDFEQVLETAIGDKLRCILKPYGITLKQNVVKLNRALKSLKGVYLQEQNFVVSFIHDAYIDAMCMVSNKRNIDVILLNCTADFFHQYIRIGGKLSQIHEDACIFEAVANENLFQCIIRLLKNGELHLVFENPMFEDDKFVDLLKDRLRQEPELFEFMTCPLENEENKQSVLEFCLESNKEPLVRFAIFCLKKFKTVFSICQKTLSACINECLCIACRLGLLNIVKELLDLGANISYRSPKSHNLDPVLWSAAFGRIEILFLLEQNGANLSSMDSKMRTIFDYLICNLSEGEKLNAKAENTLDRLMMHTDMKNLLHIFLEQTIRTFGINQIFKRFPANYVYYDGKTILHLINEYPITDISSLKLMFHCTEDVLQNKDIDVNKQDIKGKTPIICAAQSANPYTLYLLLNINGANVNITDNEGKTALHHLMITWDKSVKDDGSDKSFLQYFAFKCHYTGRAIGGSILESMGDFWSSLCMNAASCFILLAKNAEILVNGITKDPKEYVSASEKKELYTRVHEKAKKLSAFSYFLSIECKLSR